MSDAGGADLAGPPVDPQEAVDQLFGAGRARVVDAVSSTKVTEQEVILVNGVPVQLVGEDGEALKKAMLEGRFPEQSILNRVLTSVLGKELRGVSKVESSVSMTSSIVTRDTLTVHHNGKVIDERTSESRSDTRVDGQCQDTFTPVSAPSIFSSSSNVHFSSSSSPSSLSSSPSPRPPSRLGRTPSRARKPIVPNGYASGSSSPTRGVGQQSPSGGVVRSASSGRSSCGATPSTDVLPVTSDLPESLAKATVSDSGPAKKSEYVRLPKIPNPSIFGTVADDRSPRDNTKRGFPQSLKNGGTKCPHSGGVETGDLPPEWATMLDDDNSLVYEDGVLVSGSLLALVQHATPTAVYYPDTAYLFAFLLSSRLFIKPHDLLQRVVDLGFSQQGLQDNDLNTINKEKLGKFIPHMVQLLGEWSETFPYDFRDERIMAGVRALTHRCIALEPILRKDVTQVLHNLLNKLTQLEKYEEGVAKLTIPPPVDHIPQQIEITEMCSSPLVMAQQLTHIELERLSFIGPEEFVQAFAKDNLESSYKDLKKTNNLETYVQWFNRLSYTVATQTCLPTKKKQRVRMIEWWIEVARECFNIGNFNSLMGIIAGLNMSPVSRLKKTWNKVQSAKFSVLEHQMDPSSNFSSYRSTLKAAMWRSAGAVDDRQKIVIPFFSLLVKDLYFLNEGCASRLPNGHINFDKFWQLAKQVTEFMAWKQVTCPFEKLPEVIVFSQTMPILSEKGLALSSFDCEGPENSYEKERCKNLRAESISTSQE